MSTKRKIPNSEGIYFKARSPRGGRLRCEKDGVAPQKAIEGLKQKRAYIPTDALKGFLDSHRVFNYTWIFNLSEKQPGYVKSR